MLMYVDPTVRRRRPYLGDDDDDDHDTVGAGASATIASIPAWTYLCHLPFRACQLRCTCQRSMQKKPPPHQKPVCPRRSDEGGIPAGRRQRVMLHFDVFCVPTVLLRAAARRQLEGVGSKLCACVR